MTNIEVLNCRKKSKSNWIASIKGRKVNNGQEKMMTEDPIRTPGSVSG